MIGNSAPIHPHKYVCETCDYHTSKLYDYNQHISTRKHKRYQNDSSASYEKPQLCCELCNYSTPYKKDMIKHNQSKRHQQKEETQKKQPDELPKFQCRLCDKIFTASSNLSRHKRTCTGPGPATGTSQEEPTANTFLVNFIKENKELQSVLLDQSRELQERLLEQNEKLLKQNEEQCKLIAELAHKQGNIINNKTTNNNNQFNLHFFLNDTCKDALSITEFIKSLKIQVSDLEETGRLGFVDGITRIIVNGLKNVEIEKRPLHCTDLKRETVYIKNDTTWEKENDDKTHLKDAVEHISHMNLQQLRPWQVLHPEFKDTTTKENDLFIHLSTQAIGSSNREQGDRNVDKILKNVFREVVLDKSK